VSTNSVGRPLDYRHVGEAFRVAVRRAGVRADGRLSLHSLRHGYASLLIAEGLDVLFVSRQLGHADPGVTLSVYAHLFARAKHALAARSAIEAGYAFAFVAGSASLSRWEEPRQVSRRGSSLAPCPGGTTDHRCRPHTP
jgi:hypothetical protein